MTRQEEIVRAVKAYGKAERKYGQMETQNVSAERLFIEGDVAMSAREDLLALIAAPPDPAAVTVTDAGVVAYCRARSGADEWDTTPNESIKRSIVSLVRPQLEEAAKMMADYAAALSAEPAR